MPLWEIAQAPATERKKDTARFLAEVQKKYFDDKYRFIHSELGFKGVICGSNWRTASTRIFGAMDKWTQSGCDFYDHHGYVGGWSKREGDRSFYAAKSLSAWDTAPGDDRRALSLPFLPSTIAGKPGMVSEYAWMGRNPARAEMSLIVSALASQSGQDAMVLFAMSSSPAWLATTKHSWPVLTPTSIGLFPGKALLFRKGLVEEGPAKSVATINVEEMLNLAGNGFTDPSSNDANRAGEGRDTSSPGIEIQSFAYGKVAAVFSDKSPSATVKPDVATFHDPQAGVLKSANGQIEWPYKRGIFMVQAPQTQGVSGYLDRAGKIELLDMTVQSPLPFGVVWAIAMDDQPIARSRKILLQVMSDEQNHNFKSQGSPQREILAEGKAPIQIQNIEGTVRFLRPDAGSLKVTALDVNGCVKGAAGTADTITLRPDTIYYLIEK